MNSIDSLFYFGTKTKVKKGDLVQIDEVRATIESVEMAGWSPEYGPGVMVTIQSLGDTVHRYFYEQDSVEFTEMAYLGSKCTE